MEYFIKSSLVISLFFLCFHLFLRKETFFQHNRGFLIAGMVIAFVFPYFVIPIYIPVETVSVALPEINYIAANIEHATNQTSNPTFQWADLFPILYGIGLFIFFIQFLFQFGSLIVLVLKNPKNKDGIYTYVTVNYNISPFSFFKWIVYNPKNFEDDELELILTHEKVHASQLHSIDILLTQLACVIFWFNPFIWLYRKAVQQNLEYIADFKTQSISNEEKTYQHLLLKTSVANQQIPLSTNFYNSLIKERIVMLKKSRSDKRKQWRYLAILPLLTMLLMSMNTKKVYVEAKTAHEKTSNTLEFVVTKETSDSELKSISESVKQKGGSLEFSDVKRNEAEELTNIFVRFYDHSYGAGNSREPIKDFLIYKELFDLEGGYVGRLRNGTTHFGVNTLDKILTKENETTLNAFQDRVSETVIKNGLYSDKNNKKSNDTETIEVIITKDTSDEDLKNIKDTLKDKGITFEYSNVKRNSAGEITSINTEFKSKKSASNYNVSEDKGIDSFRFRSNGDNISVGSLDKNTFVFKSTNGQTKMQSTNGTNKVIVVDEDGASSTVDVKILKNKDTINFTKKNKFTFSTDDEDSNIFIHESNDPLFIINGEKVDKSLFEDVDSDDIESVFVLKGENAIKKYGNEGKNGVILMTKKGSKNLLSESEDTVIMKSNSFTFETDEDEPLFILNGNVIIKDDMKEINPNNIDNVEILKDENAIKLYGKKGENGVVIINTKKSAGQNDTEDSILIVKSLDSNSYNVHESHELMIDKSMSNAQLNQIKLQLKAIGINAKFSKVKRNKSGEITSIKISLDDNNGSKSSASWKEKTKAIPNIVMGKQGKKLFINSI